MAVSLIEIDTVQLNRDIEELESCIDQAQKNLEVLARDMEELNSSWKGQANKVFKAQFANDRELMKELLEKMKKMTSCMNYASGEYVKCENEVKDLVEKIRI